MKANFDSVTWKAEANVVMPNLSPTGGINTHYMLLERIKNIMLNKEIIKKEGVSL